MGQATPDRSRAIIERVVREEWGYTLATLVGQVRDFDLAEDVLQDAAVAALQHWPASGVPRHPLAGLQLMAELDGLEIVQSYQPYHAARADLLRRAGRLEEAASAYRRAMTLSGNQAERKFLEGRLAELG